ncbi:MAG: proline racemase family protein [Candidatus Nanopelagicales bacterium]
MISTHDYHTAGEPFRIVVDGLPDIPGGDVRQRREYALAHEDIDVVRRMLCHEPRGHADMYGCFIVPPDDDGAHFGTLFWHKDGYSTACGHGTIALGEWAVRTGRVAADRDGTTEVVIDVPSGRVRAQVRQVAGITQDITFRNVPSWVHQRNITVPTSRGVISVDISWGGAFYASVRAADLDLAVTPENLTQIIALGREIKTTLDAQGAAKHPDDDRLSGVYGTIWFDELGKATNGLHQRNVTVFADGEVDRSPCGSGTSARLALLDDSGQLTRGSLLTHESIVDTQFLASVVDETDEGVITEITSRAYPTGEATYWIDPNDALGTGFALR